MKVRNLYIGEIRIISNIEHLDNGKLLSDTRYTAKLERKSILERLDSNPQKVKDILYGGIYPIKHPIHCTFGEEIAMNLDQSRIISILENYPKTKINKRKLLQLFKANSSNK